MDFKKLLAFADRACSIALLATIAIVPLFSLPFLGVASEASKGILLSVGILLSFVCWLVSRFFQGKVTMPRSPILLAAKVFMLVMVLASLFSGSIRASFWGSGFDIGAASTFILLYLVLFLSSVIFQDRKNISKLLIGFIGVSGIVFLFQLSHLFFGYTNIFHGFLSAPTANLIGKWNDLAIFFGFVALMTFSVVRYVPLSKLMKAMFSLLCAGSIFFMLLINFLAVLVVFALSMFGIFIYELWQRKQPMKTKVVEERTVTTKNPFPKLPLALATLAVIFVLTNGFIGSFLPTRLHVLSLEVRPSFATTMTVATQTLARHPIFGVGPGKFTDAWVMYRPASVLASQFWNTDFNAGFGLIPSLFVTAGLLGGLAGLLFFLSVIYQAIKSRILAIKDESRQLVFSVFILTLFLWMMTLVYVPNIVLLVLTFAMTGLFIAVTAGKKSSDVYAVTFARDIKMKILATVVAVVLLLAAIVFGYKEVKQFIGAVYASRSVASLGTGALDDAGLSMSRAIAHDANDRYYREMTDLYITKVNSLLSTQGSALDAVKTQIQGLFGSARQTALMATSYDGSNYNNWITLARFYQTALPLGLPDAYVNAKTTYMKALALNPTNPTIYLSLANLDLANKNIDMAKQDIRGALAIKPDYTDALFLLAKIAQDSGDTQEAIRQVQKAEIADPSSFAAAFDLGILEYAVKDYANAVLTLEHAAQIDPSNLDARYFLGLSYDNTGRTQDAIAQFEYITKQIPDNQQIKDILTNLNAGRNALQTVTKPIKK